MGAADGGPRFVDTTEALTVQHRAWSLALKVQHCQSFSGDRRRGHDRQGPQFMLLQVSADSFGLNREHRQISMTTAGTALLACELLRPSVFDVGRVDVDSFEELVITGEKFMPFWLSGVRNVRHALCYHFVPLVAWIKPLKNPWSAA